MKTTLNIIISILILVIWSEIEINSSANEPYYGEIILASVLLLIIGAMRIKCKQLVEFLRQPS